MFFSTQFQNIPDPNFLNFYLNIPQAWNMSSSSTPQTGSGYASPILVTGTPPPPKPVPPKAKPTNVFSNDGSFLERFQRTKKEEDEKRKEQEALEKKRNFDNRFKNRGKRPLPDNTHDSKPAPDDLPAKKIKPDGTPTDYRRELKTVDGRSLKDSGTGVRSPVK